MDNLRFAAESERIVKMFLIAGHHKHVMCRNPLYGFLIKRGLYNPTRKCVEKAKAELENVSYNLSHWEEKYGAKIGVKLTG